MDWGQISNASEIPTPGGERDIRLTLPSREATQRYVDFVRRHADVLNMLTEDDPEKEEKMGRVIIDAFYLDVGRSS